MHIWTAQIWADWQQLLLTEFCLTLLTAATDVRTCKRSRCVSVLPHISIWHRITRKIYALGFWSLGWSYWETEELFVLVARVGYLHPGAACPAWYISTRKRSSTKLMLANRVCYFNTVNMQSLDKTHLETSLYCLFGHSSDPPDWELPVLVYTSKCALDWGWQSTFGKSPARDLLSICCLILWHSISKERKK
jgi:hypothetical protein